MVKDSDEGWMPPQRKPITEDVLDRAISAEEKAASREHQAREVKITEGELADRPKVQRRAPGVPQLPVARGWADLSV